jgi:[ribosomal protein S5]-alanine N-acetyltransferase
MNLIGSKTIETERLILKSSSMKEQKRLWEIIMEPEINKWYLTSAKSKANIKEHWTWKNQEKFYKSKVAKAKQSDIFIWSIFLKSQYTISGKEEVIGQVSTEKTKEKDISTRNVGWFIDKKYQRKGYAKEAATAMIDYMFRKVEIEKISSNAVKENIPSCKIFENLGFKKINEIEKDSPYTFYNGKLVFFQYELTKEMYLNNKVISN